MRSRTSVLAWGMFGVAILVATADMVLLVINVRAHHAGALGQSNPATTPLRFILPSIAVCTGAVGAVVASRLPRNPVGWIFAALGVEGGLQAAATEYGFRAAAQPGLPAANLTPLLAQGLGRYYFLASFTYIVFLFPDGHFISPRWRRAGQVAGVLLALGFLAQLAPAGGPRDTFSGGAMILVTGMGPAVAAVVSMALRYRGSGAVQRQQIKWILYASGAVLAGTIVWPEIAALVVGGDLVVAVATWIGIGSIVLIPLAAAIAMLRFHLYEIDLVISRTFVYASLAVLITIVYVGIVVGVGAIVGGGGRPNLALSIVATAVVAVGFQPARQRLQRVANRLVYGRRATPYEVLSEFSARVAESYVGDEVLARMAHVLADGTGAVSAEVWLSGGGSLRHAAAWPPVHEPPPRLILNGRDLPALRGVDRVVAVTHRGELLGALGVTKRAGEALTPIEQKLLEDLAHQAGLVLKNVGLTADLQARLDELKASRQRLVKAQDDERRRLERNLHDGAQQHLVAIKVKLGLATSLATKDPAMALAKVAELKLDADEALAALRDLARGIYPPLLAEKGLGAALEAQARKATLRVSVDAQGLARYLPEVEGAIYFCCLEALQNVQKYASATAVSIHLRVLDGVLHFEVRDDGQGFDMLTVQRGSGLQNIEDRVRALGGSLVVASSPGAGTTISGELPVAPAAPVPRVVATA